MFATTNQTKLVPISGAAMAATFGLFYLMQSLVASDDLEFQTPTTVFRPDFVIEKIKKIEAREVDRIPPPPEVQPEPEMKFEKSALPDGINITPGEIPVPTDIGADSLLKLDGLSDGERIPIVRVQPIYPRRALEHGVEGWVVLEFTVTKQGTVENAVVIDAEPKGYFERSALAAIQKYKYKPTVVDGQARESKGQYRMTFELTENQ
ncbi:MULTISPECIES: energy transducer TonB [Kordiimonas]|uniref:energy transducer TonB n=1 Tax=Kordiimonas TaxID=288021 RepID=UPI00257FFB6B|nr:energy transducer TonB [Kordiimonas sp. UBA4487]